MKKLILCSLLLLTSLCVWARTEKTITVDGHDRSYVFYYPTGRAASEPTQLVVALHGLGQTPDDFVAPETAQALCDQYGMALLLPLALPEQDNEIITAAPYLSAQYPTLSDGLTSVWGAGVSVSLSDLDLGSIAGLIRYFLPNIYAAGKFELNKDVDDISFINAAINDCAAGYNLSSDIYMAGGSLGGAMTYRYAFSNASKASKIAVISGFVGKEVSYPASIDYPVMVIHSQTDELITYSGSAFNEPITDIVDKLVGKNPHGSPVESTIGDSDSIIYVFNYTDDPQVLFYSVIAAKHNMSDVRYINLYEEVWDFFAGSPSAIAENKGDNANWRIWPNPARNQVNSNLEGDFTVFDLAGRAVLSGNTAQGICVAGLNGVQYLLLIRTADNRCYRTMLIKQ
ncbi:MAG: hypothetical protein J6Y77_05265 [Paludibacteraceae bacterium]|nr:hypothetical protein [Paludibacteraceae bacterium]